MNVLIIFSLLGFGIVNGACPNGWSSNRQSCYQLRDDTETWIDAKTVCEMYGAHLAEISDQAENVFIHGLLTKTSSTLAWIGGSDLSTETEWKWVASGETLTYTNWKLNEPNNSNHDENCLEIQSSGEWNDRTCHYVEKYVCERPLKYSYSFIAVQFSTIVSSYIVMFKYGKYTCKRC